MLHRLASLCRVEREVNLETEPSVLLRGVADSLHSGRVVRRREARQLRGKRLLENAISAGLLERRREPQALCDPDRHIREARSLDPIDTASTRRESSEIYGKSRGKELVHVPAAGSRVRIQPNWKGVPHRVEALGTSRAAR